MSRSMAFSMVLASLLAAACSDGGNDAQPRPGEVAFSPSVVRLDNPRTKGTTSSPQAFSIDVVAYDAAGGVIEPSADNPLLVEVHGAPPGAITPQSVALTSGSTVQFAYDGSYFPNPITLTASIDHATTSSTARVAQATSAAKSLGRSQILHANPIDCTYGTTSYTLPLLCRNGGSSADCVDETMQDGLVIEAAVGTGVPFKSFVIDTGSLGVMVPLSDLGEGAMGPGAPGVKFYDSSGRTYAGNYYLAPVQFRLADGTIVSTPAIKVLAITDAYCAKGYPQCEADPPTPTLRYLGVGFDRAPTAEDDGLDLPADNPFLQVAAGDPPSDVSPGYVLTTTSVTVGITSTAGFDTVALSPSTTIAGDWDSAPGCFAFPNLAQPNQFCGHLLLDVGIRDMFLALEKSQRPAAAVDHATSLPTVPNGTHMQIVAGSPDAPAASYEYVLSPQASGPAPTVATWIESSNTFVNTGRRPLLAFDYLYDARCGNVGFRAKTS